MLVMVLQMAHVIVMATLKIRLLVTVVEIAVSQIVDVLMCW